MTRISTPLKCLGVVVLSALALSACGREEASPLATETRELAGFTAIDLEGAASVDVTVGAEHRVEIEAPQRIIDRIETAVEGDKLVIRTRLKDWISTTGSSRVALRISLPELASLRVDGGNDVQLHGFSGGEASIRADGAAQIRATGALDSLRVYFAGAGDGDFRELVASDAHVRVDGVGNVVVHATQSLDATMNGVGSIRYTGNPSSVNTHMNGLGRIARFERGRDGDEEAAESHESEAADTAHTPAAVGELASGEVI
jgi:hypothetical protein